MTDVAIRCRGPADGTVTLALTGEIDMANAEELEEKMRSVVASTTGDVRLDCSDLTFVDSSGLAVFSRMHDELAGGERRLAIDHPRPQFATVLEITGLADLLLRD